MRPSSLDRRSLLQIMRTGLESRTCSRSSDLLLRTLHVENTAPVAMIPRTNAGKWRKFGETRRTTSPLASPSAINDLAMEDDRERRSWNVRAASELASMKACLEGDAKFERR